MDGNAVNQSTLKQVALPAAAAAVVVLLIGVLVALSDWNTKETKGPAATGGGPPAAAGRSDDQTAAGMSADLPPLDGPEWKEIGDGVKAWDVAEGTGEGCPAGANVTIHYVGWLTSGSKFDSSVDRGKPADFPLGELVKGWQVGIPGMKAGGIRRLLIPPELGYGATGRPKIPANSTLVFEIKMLGFKG